MAGSAAAYGLELQARSIAPFYHASNSVEGNSRFVVGTANYGGENKIYLLEFVEDQSVVECTAVWTHTGDVAALSCSPSTTGKCLVATVSRQNSPHGSIFSVEEAITDELTKVYTLPPGTDQILWDLDGLQNEARVVIGNAVGIVKLGPATAIADLAAKWEIKEAAMINHAALDPHHSTQCAVAANTGIALVDSRKKDPSMFLPWTRTLHGYGQPRHVDYSSSSVSTLVSAGDDGNLIFFDLRAVGAGEKSITRTVKVHDHYVNHASFNPFHEQLVITCSSDQTLKLWDIGTLECPSSSQGSTTMKAQCIKSMVDFGDSVMSCCWSSTGPWVYAGVSFNGKVLVDTVTQEKKLQILLESES